MTQAPSIKEALEAAMRAFKACRPIERVACQDFGMQQDDILEQQLEAALSAALATLQPSGERREAIARIKADPGDGTVKPDLGHILARGFHAMGWANPQAASEDVLASLASGLVQDEAAIRADERERIAKSVECDCCDVCGESPGFPKCANEIAAAIRSASDGGTS